MGSSLADKISFSREDYATAVVLPGELNQARVEAYRGMLSLECVSLEVSQQIEKDIGAKALASLFTITPKQSGFALIASATKAAIRNPKSTVVTILDTDDDMTFTEGQLKDMAEFEKVLADTGAQVYRDPKQAADYLNALHGNAEVPLDNTSKDAASAAGAGTGVTR